MGCPVAGRIARQAGADIILSAVIFRQRRGQPGLRYRPVQPCILQGGQCRKQEIKRTDRRRNRRRTDESSESLPFPDRRKQERRRQIDPTTCERDYSELEVEFMRAMDDYKRKSGRPFPTWSEVLEVLTSLGYRKVAEPSEMQWRTHSD